MRARGLKPSLFKNEILGAADPIYSLIFEGLWCLADREGRLEDRPLRIHVEINPYRDSASTVQALDWLVLQGFVIRYESGGAKFLAVANFRKHQQPHIKEPPSKIPPPENQSVVEAPDEHGASTVPARLTPSSLTADSGLLTADTSPPARAREKPPKVPREAPPDWFLDFKLAYPERAGDPGWRKAQRAANARLAEGHTTAEFLAGARRYAAYIDTTGKRGTEFVKQASTFLGPDKPFLLPWTAPATKADTRLAGNLSAAAEFMRRTEPRHDA